MNPDGRGQYVPPGPSNPPGFWSGRSSYQPEPGHWPPFPPSADQGFAFPQGPPRFDPSRPPPGFGVPGPLQVSAFVEAQRKKSAENAWAPHGGPPPRPFDDSPYLSHPGPGFGFPSGGSDGRFKTGPDWPFGDPAGDPGPPPDPDSIQREQDQRWLQRFLSDRRKEPSPPEQGAARPSLGRVREDLYGAARLLAQLTLLCQRLGQDVDDDGAWARSFPEAQGLRGELQEKLLALGDPDTLSGVRRKLLLAAKKRTRGRRRRAERAEEVQQERERWAEREAAIDRWRMKRIQEVEEKTREEEMKRAADSVLAEVRKKQADARRMVDILKSLEKLRKLRKEAAARKGVFPEKESDEVFEGHLQRLRSLIHRRMGVYGAEEKALRVMLEGEQEEERKQERERRQRKEREKRREAEAVLFGAELPPGHPLQPFQDFFLQAENSLPTLIQIRREWDQFLVPVDHPDGSPVPEGWVLPGPPADDAWASALERNI
ncbi:programmed cell death protein 7 [Denticeps clupeoides]|nr:programmed cell death protein 7 [Denticeps clupeoides]